MTIAVVVGVLLFVALARALASMSKRARRRADATAPDVRRAEDGDKPFIDYGNPIG
jgi:hypothetical protein